MKREGWFRMQIQITPEALETAQKILGNVSEKDAGKAISRAMNRAILAARTAGTKAVRQEYVISAKDVKADMTMKKASYTNLHASLTARGPMIDLMQFKVKIQSKGVFAQVKKGGGGIIPKAFFASTGKSAGVFHRTTTSRLPIQREFGPSIAQMFGNESVISQMEKRSSEVLEERLAHELDVILGGIV